MHPVDRREPTCSKQQLTFFANAMVRKNTKEYDSEYYRTKVKPKRQAESKARKQAKKDAEAEAAEAAAAAEARERKAEETRRKDRERKREKKKVRRLCGCLSGLIITALSHMCSFSLHHSSRCSSNKPSRAAMVIKAGVLK